MFGLGLTEIIVLAVVALLIFGPDKIPELMGTLGKAMRYFRRTASDLRRAIDEETGPILPKDIKLPRIRDLLEDDVPRRSDRSLGERNEASSRSTRPRPATRTARAKHAASTSGARSATPVQAGAQGGRGSEGGGLIARGGAKPDPEASEPPDEPALRSHERQARAKAIAAALDTGDPDGGQR